MELRAATSNDISAINALMLRSKAHWGYDAAFMAQCVAELTLDAHDLDRDPVIVGVLGNHIIAMARVQLSDPAILEELYVDPTAMGTGAGRQLMDWCIATAKAAEVSRLIMDADPNAERFYTKMGAVRIGLVPSGSIKGRSLPKMEIDLARVP